MRRPYVDVAVSPSVVTSAAAADLLAKRGLKLTPIKRWILNALNRGQKAVGAYDLAAAYERESGLRTAPYAVYRALEFLEAQGLVAHLASTRTFVACTPRQGAETSLFFVCSECGVTSERRDPDVEKMVRLAADAIGFRARARAIDVEGICRKCSQGRGEHISRKI